MRFTHISIWSVAVTLLSNRSAKAEQDPAVGGRNPRNKIEPIFQYDTTSKDSTFVKLVQSITYNAHQEIIHQ